jgi:uncharacterized protein (DUF2236 family)
MGTGPGPVVMPPDHSALVTEQDLERALATVRAAEPPLAGEFGPASVTWRLDREALLFLGAGRALLLQLAHPWIAAAIAEHSRALADPVGRFHRTFGITYAVVFGTLDQALAAARRLHRRHAAIQGVLPEAAGPYAAGSPYRANDVAALRWVHATLTETALAVHDLLLPPLAEAERARYYAESQLYAALFGIPRTCLPPNWAAFAAYNEAMWQSEILTVSPVARALAEQIFAGTRPWLRFPLWYRAITARMLPPRLREAFGLRYGDEEHRLAERTLVRIRHLYPLLPKRLRYVGPYQEAAMRLRGQVRPDLITRWLNRLWIGRRQLG